MTLLKKIELGLGLITVLAILLLLWRLDHVNNDLKTTRVQLETMEEKNAAITTVATKAVNRPRTDDDVLKRLCSWGDMQYKHETGKKQQLPIRACN